MKLSVVDENGVYQVEELNYGDIWYFPKGTAHTIQGLADENEYLLVFDDGDFDKVGYVTNMSTKLQCRAHVCGYVRATLVLTLDLQHHVQHR